MMQVARPEWAMCIGGGSCVWDDVLQWEAIYGQQWDGLVIAANDVGAHWPRPLHHWVTLHEAKLPRWWDLRERSGHPMEPRPVRWGHSARSSRMKSAHLDRCITAWNGGSSGMLAAQVALHLGCTRVVLCGIPMTMTPHFAETRERFHSQWLAANGHWKAWSRERGKLIDVRSMSGRTRELLGEPTREWLIPGAPPTILPMSFPFGGG